MEKDTKLIDELIRILTEQELTEVSYEEKEFKIKIKKDAAEEKIYEEETVGEETEDFHEENIKSIKNISRNEKSICRTTLQNIRWEGSGKHFFHIIK